MKGIDIFCSSPASTAICVSIQDQRSLGRHGGGGGGGSVGGGSRAIDRYNPHLIDRSRRIRHTPQVFTTTTSSSTSVASSSSQKPPPPPPTKPRHNHDQHHHQHQNIKRKKKKKTSSSSLPAAAALAPTANKPITYDNDDLIITPGSSSRYLLGDTAYLDVISELEPQADHFSSSSTSALVHLDSATATRSIINTVESSVAASKDVASSSSSSSTIITPTSPDRPSTSSSSSSSSRCLDQVVELKVSLHCRGCERKMKKHISRMQGVRTFSIDFATKKVTVIGDVSPLSVLDSISRVKNASFWSSSATPSNRLMSCR